MYHIVLMIYNSLVLFNLLWCGKKALFLSPENKYPTPTPLDGA